MRKKHKIIIDTNLLSLAKDNGADYLITGDNDLLILEKFEKTKIITIKEYELLRK